MKKAILVGFFILGLILSNSANAQQIWVSPEPGEGPVQLAERYKVSPVEFIKLNRSMGKFIDPNRVSLIYTWQSFLLPESESGDKLSGKRSYIENSNNKPSGENIREGVSVKKPVVASKEGATTLAKYLSSYHQEISQFVNNQAINIISALVFLFCLCVFYILVNIALNHKSLLSTFKEKFSSQKTKKLMFFVCFSDAFSSYFIMPSDNKIAEMQIKRTLDGIAETAALLCLKYQENDVNNLIEYKPRLNKSYKIWRVLKEHERMEFEHKTMGIINSSENTTWNPNL